MKVCFHSTIAGPGWLKKVTFSWECDYPKFAVAKSDGDTATADCGSCLKVGNIIKPIYGKLENSCNATSSYR